MSERAQFLKALQHFLEAVRWDTVRNQGDSLETSAHRNRVVALYDNRAALPGVEVEDVRLVAESCKVGYRGRDEIDAADRILAAHTLPAIDPDDVRLLVMAVLFGDRSPAVEPAAHRVFQALPPARIAREPKPMPAVGFPMPTCARCRGSKQEYDGLLWRDCRDCAPPPGAVKEME